MKSFGLLVLLIAVVHTASSGKVCRNKSDCASNECCQVLSEEMILSKRDIVDGGFAPFNQNGTCEPYKLEGEYCSDDYNGYSGHCSCEPGTRCKLFEVKITGVSPRFRRDEVPSRPGYYHETKCAKA